MDEYLWVAYVMDMMMRMHYWKVKDRHWGWMLKHKATMIQTDRPQELIHYLEEKGIGEICNNSSLQVIKNILLRK